MPTFSEAPYTICFLDGLGRKQDQQHRSSDLPHVSQVIRDLGNRIPGRTQRTAFEELSAVDKATLERMGDFGFMFEHAIERGVKVARAIAPQAAIEAAWKARMGFRRRDESDVIAVSTQGEMCVDEMYLTPDGFNHTHNRGEEYKATWRSMKRMAGGAHSFKSDFIDWYWQIGAYCRALNVLTYDLFVYWVCGDWKPPFPQVRVYTLQYTADEVAHIWKMLCNHRDYMVREGLWKPPMPSKS